MSLPAVDINRHGLLLPPTSSYSMNEGAKGPVNLVTNSALSTFRTREQGPSSAPRPTTTTKGPMNLFNKPSALRDLPPQSFHFHNIRDFNVEAKPTPCFSMLKSEVVTVSELIAQHQAFCQSGEFDAFVSLWGIDGPTFKASPYIERPVFERFSKAWNDLAPDSVLGLVFHGTSEGNIQSILAHGLDPRRRKRQAFGPGEYFSTDPCLSVSYCNGGLEMLVFLVVIPPARPQRAPHDYVVVNDNDHQLPLGSFTFKSVDQTVLRGSIQKRQQLAHLSRMAEEKTRQANVAMFKATIIQHLIRNKVDVASEKYQKHKDQLCHISKREISMYVHRVVDADVISFYFPELPEPMMAEERDVAAIKSVDETVRDAANAKELLDKATMAAFAQN